MPEPTQGSLPKDQLDPDALLMQEFAYAAETANQANEDRVKVFNYYLAVAATAIAAVFTVATEAQDGGNPALLYPLALLFVVLALLGVLSLLHLARLRCAWIESAKAMCRIKKYYLKAYPELKEAFRWTEETIPLPGAMSVALLLGLTIICLSSVSLSASLVLFVYAGSRAFWLGQGMTLFVVAFVIQVIIWYVLCPSQFSRRVVRLLRRLGQGE